MWATTFTAKIPPSISFKSAPREIFGKEAALFVPTGCMGNLICIKIWTHHGNEVICEERSHVNLYELASMSAIAGCMPRAVRGGDDGILTWKQIEAAIRPKIYYDSQTALVCLENTSNMAGGTVYPTERVNEICDHAHALGLKVHLDGARIFNAAVALGDNVANMTRKCDSVMFCLSKGLGAPGRLHDCRLARIHRTRAHLPQNVWRRHAPGWRDLRRRDLWRWRNLPRACTKIMPTRSALRRASRKFLACRSIPPA